MSGRDPAHSRQGDRAMTDHAHPGSKRCEVCCLHHAVCVCGDLPRLAVTTRLVVIMHHNEQNRRTNTSRLAMACLPGSTIAVRRKPDREGPAPLVDDDGQELLADLDRPAVLFPAVDALPLDVIAADPARRPRTLLVPDGTWREAIRMRRRIPGLRALPVVSLPSGRPTRYRPLRRTLGEDRLSTFEAVARAFGILEGDEIRATLERVFRVVVDRHLWIQGRLPAHQVTGGIPEGATRDDPWSGPARG
jgi:DTW domain-containing protein YfiP